GWITPLAVRFTSERGCDATTVSKPGVHGRTCARDFLRSVKKEGIGRIRTPVNGHNYIRYNGGSYGFSSAPTGGGGVLVPRLSAAAKWGQSGLHRGVILETSDPTVQTVFGSARWKIVDACGGLRGCEA